MKNLSTYEQNPEAPMSPDELRHISTHNFCNTLEGFLYHAKDAQNAARLSQLANALRMDKTPFRPNTPNSHLLAGAIRSGQADRRDVP